MFNINIKKFLSRKQKPILVRKLTDVDNLNLHFLEPHSCVILIGKMASGKTRLADYIVDRLSAVPLKYSENSPSLTTMQKVPGGIFIIDIAQKENQLEVCKYLSSKTKNPCIFCLESFDKSLLNHAMFRRAIIIECKIH